MPRSTNTTLLYGLICVLALIVTPVLAEPGQAQESGDQLPSANFNVDYPLQQIRGKTFKNETVQLDGNEFIDCTFDNVILEFDGQAPFRFTNDHFETRSKIEIKSNNPVVRATIGLVAALMKLEKANQPKENK